MKKLLTLILLLSGINIFGAANGDRPETEKADYHIIIQNQSGQGLFMEDPVAIRHTLGGVGRAGIFGKDSAKHFSNIVADKIAYVMGEKNNPSYARGWREAFDKYGFNNVLHIIDSITGWGKRHTLSFPPNEPKYQGRETFAIKKNDKGEFYIEKISEEDL